MLYIHTHILGLNSVDGYIYAVNPEHSLDGLKLKLQYFGHLMWRANSLEKTLVLGKTEGKKDKGNKGCDDWMASLT